jgi:hypothetical protein
MKKLCAIVVFACIGLTAAAKINEYNGGNTITISPNPNKGIFTLNMENNQAKIKVEIYNEVGQRVYSAMVNNSKTEIDLSKQGKGIYNVFLTDENKNVVNRNIMVE